MNKMLVEVLRELSNTIFPRTCRLKLNEEWLELGKFVDKYGKDYLRKLKVKEVRLNDLFMEYEIIVEEVKDECK